MATRPGRYLVVAQCFRQVKRQTQSISRPWRRRTWCQRFRAASFDSVGLTGCINWRFVGRVHHFSCWRVSVLSPWGLGRAHFQCGQGRHSANVLLLLLTLHSRPRPPPSFPVGVPVFHHLGPSDSSFRSSSHFPPHHPIPSIVDSLHQPGSIPVADLEICTGLTVHSFGTFNHLDFV
jgi:hypothetical protein